MAVHETASQPTIDVKARRVVKEEQIEERDCGQPVAATVRNADTAATCLGGLRVKVKVKQQHQRHALSRDLLDGLRIEISGSSGPVHTHASSYGPSYYTAAGTATATEQSSPVLGAKTFHGTETEVTFRDLPADDYSVWVIAPPNLTIENVYEVIVAGKHEVAKRDGSAFEAEVNGGQETILEINVDLALAKLRCYAYYDCTENGQARRNLVNGVSISLLHSGEPYKCGVTQAHHGDDKGGYVEFEVPAGVYAVQSGSSVKIGGCDFHLAYDSPSVVSLRPGETGCPQWIHYVRDQARIFVSAAAAIDDLGCEGQTRNVPVDATFSLFREGDPQFFQQASCVAGQPASFDALAEGTYQVVACSPFATIGNDTYQLAWPAAGSFQVMVCCGQDLDLSHQFRYRALAANETPTLVAGTITDASGAVVAGSRVDLVEKRSGRVLWSTVSDGDGNYAVPHRHGELEIRVGGERFAIPRAAAQPASLSQTPAATPVQPPAVATNFQSPAQTPVMTAAPQLSASTMQAALKRRGALNLTNVR